MEELMMMMATTTTGSSHGPTQRISGAPMYPKGLPVSVLTFHVHPELPEVQRLAREEGWLEQGWTALEVSWEELHFTTDGWRSLYVLRSSDEPSPFAPGGQIFLPGVPAGTPVEFALQLGVVARRPDDPGGERAHGTVWLNNGGSNYRQISRPVSI
jgi:hypothetical protein